MACQSSSSCAPEAGCDLYEFDIEKYEEEFENAMHREMHAPQYPQNTTSLRELTKIFHDIHLNLIKQQQKRAAKRRNKQSEQFANLICHLNHEQQ